MLWWLEPMGKGDQYRIGAFAATVLKLGQKSPMVPPSAATTHVPPVGPVP